MKTGAAYIRVSTEEQVEFSPDSQLKKIEEYAKHNDIILPEKFIFIDEGISGKCAKKRPEFMKMIETAKTKPKPFDLILVWKFSRFARNRQDSIVYKSMLRKNFDINVISITEQLSNEPTSILIEALLEAMDEYYSINLAQEVKRGMNEKFSRGGIVNAPPLGYKMGKNTFEIDEENSKIIKMIFDSFISGISTRQIAMKLNEIGILSKRGNKFEHRTIEYILSNPVYIGKLRRNTSGNNKHDRYHRGKDVTIINGNHIPIIDNKTFETANKILSDAKKHHRINTKKTDRDFMLRGIVRCSNCGATLTQSVNKKSLQCNKYAKGQCDKSHSISINKINEAVLKKIETDINKGILDIKLKKLKINGLNCIQETLLKREYKKLERIKSAYENGIYSINEYKTNKSEALKKINKLKNEISKQLINTAPTQNELKKQLKNIIGKFKSHNLSETEKNNFLKSFVSKIVFDRINSTIQIYYYI